MSGRRIAVFLFLAAAGAHAYPEFQQSIRKTSEKPVDCALCHRHADGPEGIKPGQIGALSPAAQEQLNLARRPQPPGVSVNSPILNEFGNYMITTLGKEIILSLRSHPELLVGKLDARSDLDRDGVPDAREIQEGTHPLMELSGNPWTLFLTNLSRNRFHVLVTVLATILGLYGLRNLLEWFSRAARRHAKPGGDEDHDEL